MDPVTSTAAGVSRAIAMLQATGLRQRFVALAAWRSRHELVSSTPNPARTRPETRLPLNAWRFTGHDAGNNYSGAMLRAIRAGLPNPRYAQ